MAEYKGLSGKSYRTQNSPFAGGGEGDVYDVVGALGYVAKVYKPDKRTTERERKLSVMVSNKPSVMGQYAWPLDVLYENGQFIGYIMPKINGKEKLRNIYVYDKRKGKPWPLFIAIAKNLSAAVHNVHEIHQVVGDLNPENILVNPNDGMVTLVDTDSYHISDSSRTYRCGVGMPEFVAPELQGIHFPSAPLPTFTPESDRFALAVLIFALLMNGAHPFSCKVISGSSSKFQPIDNMQNGKCAFFPDSRTSNMDIPRYAPDLSSLPDNIQKLFRRAFVAGHGTPSLRPSAEEWYNALEQLEDNLKTCLKDTQHIYYYGAKECPWCKVNEKMHSISQSAFNSSSQTGSNSISGHRPTAVGGQAQQFVPSRYQYTPSSSGNSSSAQSTSTRPIGYGKWIGIIAGVLALFFIFRACSNSNDGNSNNSGSIEITSGDITLIVGETAQISVESTTSYLSVSYDDIIEIGESSRSGSEYVIDITGTEIGTSDIKIYDRNNENVYDTITVTVISDPEYTSDYVSLRKLTYTNSNNEFVSYDTVVDNFGTTYSNGFGGAESGEDTWQEYTLDGTYKEIRGRVVLNYDARTQTNDDVFLWIYGDGIILYMSQPVIAGCEPQDFVVDISDISTLRIVISGKNMLRLVDCGLYADSSIATMTTEQQINSINNSSVYLSDLDWYNASSSDGGFEYYTTAKDNFGTTYGNGIGGTDGHGQTWQEYMLRGEFQEIRGRVVLNYDRRTQESDDVFLWIYGDGNLLYQSQVVTAGCSPEDFCISVANVDSLRVVIQGENLLRLVDCVLYSDSNSPTISSAVYAAVNEQSRVYLSDLNWYNASDSDGGFSYYTSVKDNFDTIYGNGLGGTNGNGQSWQEYKLNYAYKTISGKVVLNYDRRTQESDDVFLWIYGDGVLLYQSQVVTAGCSPQEFSIDISNVDSLRVVVQGENLLRLVDCILSK